MNQVPGCLARNQNEFATLLQENIGRAQKRRVTRADAIRPIVAIEQGTMTIASNFAEPLTKGTLRSFSEYCAIPLGILKRTEFVLGNLFSMAAHHQMNFVRRRSI